MMKRALLAAPLLVSLVACEDHAASPRNLSGPDAFLWQGRSFSIRDAKGARGSLNLTGGHLSLYVRGFPAKTTLEINGTTVVTDTKGSAELKAGVAASYGDVRVDALPKGRLSGLVVSVTPPGGTPFEVPLPELDVYDADDYLLGADKGPVPFVGDRPRVGPPRNAIWFHGAPPKLVGKSATTLRELDAVAILKRGAEAGKRQCDGYKDDSGKPQPDVTIHLKPVVMTLHDRRSGEALATKTFPPVDRCPRWLTGKQGKKIARDSEVPTEDVIAWLSETVAGT